MSICRAANTTTNRTANVNYDGIDERAYGIINDSYAGQTGCLMQYIWMAAACQSSGGSLLQNRSGGPFNPDAVGYDDHFLCLPPNQTWEGFQEVGHVVYAHGLKVNQNDTTEYWNNYGGFFVCKRPPNLQPVKGSATPKYGALLTVTGVATLALMVVSVSL